MNHQLNNNPHPIFPVNYPFNHPETTTMNEAPGTPPKPSSSNLSFPTLCKAGLRNAGRLCKASAFFMADYTRSGSLLTFRLARRALYLLKKASAPLSGLMVHILALVLHKINQWADKFFRFMDYFFLMDEQDFLVVTIYSDTEKSSVPYSRNVVSAGSFHFAELKTSFRKAMHFKSGTFFHTEETPAGFIDFEYNQAAFLDSTKEAFARAKTSRSVLKSFHTAVSSIRMPLPNLNLLKLPFITRIEDCFAIFNSLKFPVAEKVFNMMDPLVLKTFEQNQFAHEE